MNLKNKLFLLLSLTTATWMVGCGGTGDGTLSVGLTDAPGDEFSAVYVTIDRVDVHAKGEDPESESGWITIAEPNRTYNLLDLRDGVVEGLGEGPLEAGSYTQIRLIIGDTPDASANIDCHPHPVANYAIDADDGEIHELKVPSGMQTGIKIICAGKCDIAENQTTEMILDFDAAASITPSFNLQPTIKVLGVEDFSIVSGTVREAGDPNQAPPISTARVSAQIFDAGALDLANQVAVRNSTQTELDGTYDLFLKPGEYNIVAVEDGFSTAAINVTALAGTVLTPIDFALAASETSTVSGSVSIGGITEPTFANVSFRQNSVLAGEVVEVASADVLSGEAFSVLIPAGDYQVVSSTCELPTQEIANVTLAAPSADLPGIVF